MPKKEEEVSNHDWKVMVLLGEDGVKLLDRR